MVDRVRVRICTRFNKLELRNMSESRKQQHKNREEAIILKVDAIKTFSLTRKQNPDQKVHPSNFNMTCVTTNSIFSFTLLTFSLFFLTFSNAFQDFQDSPFLEDFNLHGRKVDGVLKWENDVNIVKRRILAENVANKSSPLILAAKNTNRQDPLDNYNLYTGGWNISNEHYWTSVAYTAAPFFVIAAVWFLIFGISLICTCLYFCCCRRAPYGYSRVCYALSLILLVFFTVCAIVGCIFLFIGQAKFHTSTAKTLDYAVSQADYTVDNLNNVSNYLSDARKIGVGELVLPEELQNQISDVKTKLNEAATTLQSKTQDNSKKIHKVLDNVRVALIIIAAVMLFVSFIGLLVSIFGFQCLVYTLIVLGWLLVTLTFILCGLFLVLHNVVSDTCIAMDQWVQNPTAHTALDDILPCVDNATAQQTLAKSKEVTYQLANMVDVVIGTIANTDPPPNTLPPIDFNQSGPFVPLLCNPLNSDFTKRKCTSGEVDFSNAPQVWKNYVCEAKRVNKNDICTTKGRLTPTLYSQMTSAGNVAYGLYHYTPFLVEVQDCTFVRRTFSDFSANYCPGLKKYTKWIYIGLILVSAGVMCSLILWIIYARERRHRVYTKLHVGGEH